MDNFDIVLMGHFARDREVVGGEETDMLGGAVYFGAFPLKLMGVNVGVVTKLAEKDFPALSVFKEANIPVFASRGPETTGMKNVYPTEERKERTSYPIGFAGPFEPSDFPELETRIIHIGALLRGEVPAGMIRDLAVRGEIGLDLQGFVRVRKGRDVLMEEWEEAEEVLQHVTYLKADDREIEILTGNRDFEDAAKKAAEMGPDEVVLTHNGGVVVYRNGEINSAPFTPEKLDGRTGRGDTCMATYLGRRVLGESPGEAAYFAAALTSLKLEEPGPYKGSMEEVQKVVERIKEKPG